MVRLLREEGASRALRFDRLDEMRVVVPHEERRATRDERRVMSAARKAAHFRPVATSRASATNAL